MRGLRATVGREGEESTKAALGFARGDAEVGRREFRPARRDEIRPRRRESHTQCHTGRVVNPLPYKGNGAWLRCRS